MATLSIRGNLPPQTIQCDKARPRAKGITWQVSFIFANNKSPVIGRSQPLDMAAVTAFKHLGILGDNYSLIVSRRLYLCNTCHLRDVIKKCIVYREEKCRHTQLFLWNITIHAQGVHLLIHTSSIPVYMEEQCTRCNIFSERNTQRPSNRVPGVTFSRRGTNRAECQMWRVPEEKPTMAKEGNTHCNVFQELNQQ